MIAEDIQCQVGMSTMVGEIQCLAGTSKIAGEIQQTSRVAGEIQHQAGMKILCWTEVGKNLVQIQGQREMIEECCWGSRSDCCHGRHGPRSEVEPWKTAGSQRLTENLWELGLKERG